jgi:hypothetical protein
MHANRSEVQTINLSRTLPAWSDRFPDQHKQRTSTLAGTVHRRSKLPHTVQLHRLLQICSRHRSVNEVDIELDR